ncbi:protein PPP1R35 homolog [Ochlerotatus camptorhynchus]|uniref:protein PPP1R35 homolog n=1 Tax=Ochlerotatus camptorhynchus TaxID=644619 RepID=UPI0031E347EA
MSKLSKSNYRKCFLRNVEIPLARSKAKVLKPTQITTAAATSRAPTQNRISTGKATDSNKFKQPELHSALNVRKEIEKVKSTHTKAPTSIGELTPKSKKFVRDQISKKLNFQHDENVFKGLVPVNVNDSVLIPTGRKPLSSRYIAKEKRDPEPELGDFLRPITKCNVPFEPYLPPEPAPRRPNFNNFDNIIDVFGKIDVGA